jgi:hypothetical protein
VVNATFNAREDNFLFQRERCRMILRVPGTAGKQESCAKGGNEWAERAKRQVLHSRDAPFTTFCWWRIAKILKNS